MCVFGVPRQGSSKFGVSGTLEKDCCLPCNFVSACMHAQKKKMILYIRNSKHTHQNEKKKGVLRTRKKTHFSSAHIKTWHFLSFLLKKKRGSWSIKACPDRNSLAQMHDAFIRTGHFMAENTSNSRNQMPQNSPKLTPPNHSHCSQHSWLRYGCWWLVLPPITTAAS